MRCLVCFLLWVSPSVAFAAAAPPPPAPPVPLTALVANGNAALEDVSITVSCDVSGHPAPGGRCEVDARFTLVAIGPVRLERLEPAESRGGAVTLIDGDGAPLEAPLELGRGERVSVHMNASRGLQTRVASGLYLMMSPMVMRHVLLGESRELRRSGDGVSGVLVEGPAVEVRGPVRVDARNAGRVRVTLAGEEVHGVVAREVPNAAVGLSLQPDAPSDLPLQPGGPALYVGAAMRLEETDEDARFSMAASYELGITDFFFLSAAFETDFHSIMESVVFEAATPLVLLLPGVLVGTGVVFRQLGDRDPDAAFRMRVGVQVPVIAMVADLDYWPTVGEWTGTIRARLSL